MPCVLINIPDGHTKTMEASSAKVKAREQQKTQAPSQVHFYPVNYTFSIRNTLSAFNQGSLMCASRERRSQAHNPTQLISAGTILPYCIWLSNTFYLSAGTFFSDHHSQVQNTFNEAFLQPGFLLTFRQIQP